MSFEVSSITSYPIKGLAGKSHHSVTVTKGGLIPGDRAYALSSGTSASLTAHTNSWLKKAHFLQTMTTEALAALALTFDADTTYLTLHDHLRDITMFEGYLNREDDSARLCDLMATYLGQPNNVPRLFHLSDGGMTDTKTPYVAFGNAASITDFATKAGINDAQERFRLNVMMQGLAPFAENELIGKCATIGTAIFRFIEPVGRCAAIEVDPQTAERRTGLVQDLQRVTGASDMGIFATIEKSGQFRCGDSVIITD